MRKWMLISIMMLIAQNALALQMKSVVDNETISVKIASQDVTRIFVQGDRIKSVKGIKGAYTRENDDKNGEIYLQPTMNYQTSAFTVMLETEKGHHYTIILNPMSVPAETLMLVPKGVGREAAAKFEQAAPYEMTLTHLMQAMVANQMPEGYAVYQIDNKKKCYRLGNIADFRLVTVYQGLNLQGEVFELTNRKSYPITIDEASFYKLGTRAISLSTTRVDAHDKAYIYRISSHA